MKSFGPIRDVTRVHSLLITVSRNVQIKERPYVNSRNKIRFTARTLSKNNVRARYAYGTPDFIILQTYAHCMYVTGKNNLRSVRTVAPWFKFTFKMQRSVKGPGSAQTC